MGLHSGATQLASALEPGEPFAASLRTCECPDGSTAKSSLHRILLVHKDSSFLTQLEEIFDEHGSSSFGELGTDEWRFELHSAASPGEVLGKLGTSITAGRPYAMAFLDLCTRCVEDFNPAEVITHLWQACPDLPVVVCTACPDLENDVLLAKANRPDQISLLRKPFSPIEVRHMTRSLLRRAEGVTLENDSSAVHVAAGIAHDFNNIFSIIHGHATMVLMKLGNEGAHAQSMVEIRRATERGAEVVRRLLALDNCGPIQMRQVELACVVQSLESMLRVLAGPSIQVELATHAQVSPILADRSLVEQLILNLAVNARNAMPGGGQLRLGLMEIVPTDEELVKWRHARSGRFVRLEIADSGRGMHPEVLKQLLDPGASSGTSGKRIGLGLTSVLRTIKRHQASFSVQVEPGRGTRFQVHFPVIAE